MNYNITWSTNGMISDSQHYQDEIDELIKQNGSLTEQIVEIQDKIEHNIRRIKALRNLIRKDKMYE